MTDELRKFNGTNSGGEYSISVIKRGEYFALAVSQKTFHGSLSATTSYSTLIIGANDFADIIKCIGGLLRGVQTDR